MFRSLMVPLDGSAFGEHALPYALCIARQTDAQIELVRVHQPQIPVGPAAIGLELLDAQLREIEEEYLAALRQRLAPVATTSLSTQLIDGLVADALIAHAHRSNVDLVVMTTHGKGPLSRFWLGSVADKLLRQLNVPVLLVRPQEAASDVSREPAFQRVLIPLDGSEIAERILDSTIALGAPSHAEYTLLRIVDPTTYLDDTIDKSASARLGASTLERIRDVSNSAHQEATVYLEGVAERLRAQGHSVQVRVVSDSNHAAAILKSADAYASDLVAMATHGRGGLKRMILGSIADKVVRGSQIPVLVHNSRDEESPAN